jgi:hypothetical protein
VQDVDRAVELDPAEQVVTLVKVQLDPAGQSTHSDAEAYEYVPLVQAVFIPPVQA